jgi:CBS domain-containing protein
MKCKDIMKTDVECISSDDTVQAAARCMSESNIGFLPVCVEGGRVIGTVTDRDLAVRVIAEGKSFDSRIVEVMTPEVVACRPEDNIKTAHELMANSHKSRLMCIDKYGKLCGVISLSDIAEHDNKRRTLKTWQQINEREVRA